LYKNDRDNNQFSEALKYYEKSHALATANNDPNLTTRTESMISTVHANMTDGKYDTAGILKQKKMYEARVREGGESSFDAVNFGVGYAEIIKRVQHRGVESERLFMKLREICQQVHGSDHKLTKHVHSKRSKQSSVWMRSEVTGDSYILMDYDVSFEKCIGMNKNMNVLSAILNESKGGGEFRMPIDSLSIDEVVFDNGTIVYSSPHQVECNGDLDKFVLGDMRCSQLVDEAMIIEYDQEVVDGRLKPAEMNFKGLKLGDVRAWDKDTGCYTIHWEDESIPPCKVPRDRVFVPNCICKKCIESNQQFMFTPNKHFPKNCEWDQDK